ncbi:unnamed protein product [Ectocarpus sp. 12 AP-2014]
MHVAAQMNQVLAREAAHVTRQTASISMVMMKKKKTSSNGKLSPPTHLIHTHLKTIKTYEFGGLSRSQNGKHFARL